MWWKQHWQYSCILVLGFGIGITDQILKYLILDSKANTGGFLGVGVSGWLLTVLHILVVLGAGWWAILHRQQQLAKVVFVVIIASISNLVDRLRWEYVIDYLQLFGVWFNLADLTVTLGLIAAAIIIFKQKK